MDHTNTYFFAFFRWNWWRFWANCQPH